LGHLPLRPRGVAIKSKNKDKTLLVSFLRATFWTTYIVAAATGWESIASSKV